MFEPNERGERDPIIYVSVEGGREASMALIRFKESGRRALYRRPEESVAGFKFRVESTHARLSR